MRDVAALVRVQAEREVTEDDRLDVEHQVAADEVGRVADLAAQQQARRLERAAGDDDGTRADLVRLRVGVEVTHTAAPLPRRVEQHVERDALGSDLAQAGVQRPPQRCDRIALGLDRTAVERAEAAVVARGPTVVRDAVRAGGRAVRVVAELLGRRHGQRREEHVGAGGHRVRTAAPGRERVAGVIARDTDDAFRFRVERFDLCVVDGPVRDVGAGNRAELGTQPEVDLAQTGQLAVGVVTGAAQRRGHVVQLAREEALAVGSGTPVRTRFQQRIGAEEVTTVELDLVARDVPEGCERRVEVQQVVATLLEDAHRLARGREHLGRGGAARAGADDDDVELRHASPRRRSSRAVARHPRSRSPSSR